MINSIIRRYKMHQITPCLTENEVKLFEYIKDIFNNTIPYKPNSTIINSIFYMNKEGKCVYRFTESSNPNYSVSKEFVKNLMLSTIEIYKFYEHNLQSFRNMIYDILMFIITNNVNILIYMNEDLCKEIERLYKIDKL